MEIIWHGHSCFELVSGGFSLVLDPYCHRELCGYPELDLEADAVLCSHGHYGHGWTEAVSLRHGAHDPFEVETLDSFHDVMGGRLRGENRIHILKAEGLKLVHLGDLGRPLTGAELERISGADALMVPIGGILTIEPYAAYRLCRDAAPRLVLPMHYNVGGGSRRLRRREEWTSLFEPEELAYSGSDRLTLTAEQRPDRLVLMLTPPGGSA